jgi:hypothetical protein
MSIGQLGRAKFRSGVLSEGDPNWIVAAANERIVVLSLSFVETGDAAATVRFDFGSKAYPGNTALFTPGLDVPHHHHCNSGLFESPTAGDDVGVTVFGGLTSMAISATYVVLVDDDAQFKG